jgi:hypothetical protein
MKNNKISYIYMINFLERSRRQEEDMQYINEIILGIAEKIKNPIIDIISDFILIFSILLLKYLIIIMTTSLFGIPPFSIQFIEMISNVFIIIILIRRLIELVIDIYAIINFKLLNNDPNEYPPFSRIIQASGIDGKATITSRLLFK